MSPRRRFSPEFKAEAVRMVVEGGVSVAAAARQLDLVEQTLRNWVEKHNEAHPRPVDSLTDCERVRLRELEREVAELRMKNEFLGKAAAFFARDYR
ncbi:Mobile element protein [Alloactinosynnema sp. L-07]|nr:Mobile element protein [Alloactinosynnema sp. L-07]CRK61518.1 Mobile element protein [Alloactinosynnema sp. L-07]